VAKNGDPAFVIAVLAHVMVHEITNVLQRIDRHSEEGIMRAHWSSLDYHRMTRHPLTFALEDVELIRLGLASSLASAKHVATNAHE
jgi:hypothetical protein